MKPPSVSLRISRLVIDEPFHQGVTAGTLAETIRSELVSRLSHAQVAPSRATAHPPLAGRIADAVAPRVQQRLPDAVRQATSGRSAP